MFLDGLSLMQLPEDYDIVNDLNFYQTNSIICSVAVNTQTRWWSRTHQNVCLLVYTEERTIKLSSLTRAPSVSGQSGQPLHTSQTTQQLGRCMVFYPCEWARSRFTVLSDKNLNQATTYLLQDARVKNCRCKSGSLARGDIILDKLSTNRLICCRGLISYDSSSNDSTGDRVSVLGAVINSRVTLSCFSINNAQAQ